MKKLIAILLILILCTTFVSCINKKIGLSDEKKQKLEDRQKEIEKSEDAIRKYLELVMQERYEEAEKYYENNKGVDRIYENKNELKPLGYNLDNVEKIGEGVNATVNTMLGEKNKAFYSTNTMVYNVLMNKKDNSFKIKQVGSKSGADIFTQVIEEDNWIVTRDEKSAKTTPLIKLNDIPKHIFSKTGRYGERKLNLDNKDVGSISITPDSNQAVFSLPQTGYDVLLIAERTMEINAKNYVAEATEGKTNGKIEDSTQKSVLELHAMDFFDGGKIEYSVFSADSEYVLAVINMGNNKRIAKVYCTEKKEESHKKEMEQFNSPEYTILRAYFNSEKSIILSVKNLKTNKIENYIVDIKLNKIIKQDK